MKRTSFIEFFIFIGTYDAVCIMGSVFYGHISLGCLPEMMRIAKPGIWGVSQAEWVGSW